MIYASLNQINPILIIPLSYAQYQNESFWTQKSSSSSHTSTNISTISSKLILCLKAVYGGLVDLIIS